MLQSELLKRVIDVLNKNGIDYMITGSIASSLHGIPRSTHDIDIIVMLSKKDIAVFIQSFQTPEFYIDEQSIIDAMKYKSMFNLIHLKEGDKVDFWILTESDFDTTRFSRKYEEKISDIKVKVSTPEDTILSKLQWAKLSDGSERQLYDATRVYEIQYHKLNISYIEQWVKKLQLTKYWNQLLKISQDESESR